MTAESQERVGAFLWAAISSSAWAIKDALKFSRWATIALCFVRLIEAAMPALQVVLVSYFVSGRSGAELALGDVLLLVLITGGIVPLSAMVDALNLRLQLVLRYAYTYEVVDIYASLTASQRRDTATVDEVQAAHDAIPFNLSWQATSALNIVGAFVTAVMLFCSLAGFDVLAAALVTLSLLPQLFGYSLVARAENEYWPKQAAGSRRAEYLENQLRYARSGTELSLLGGAAQFANWAKEKHKVVRGYWMKTASIRFLSALGAGMVALVLIAFALCSLVWRVHVRTDVLAAAILGVVSAMLATKNAGSAYGELMASAPIVMRYVRLRDRLQARAPEQVAQSVTQSGVARGPLLGCEAVRFSYTGEEDVLNDLSLEVDPGRITAVVGANGAGKSTAIKVLTGQLTSQAGTVHALVSPSDIAVMPQDVEKFELTLKEFLCLPYYSTRVPSDEELWDALKKVGLAVHVKGFKDGLDTQLGEQWDGTDLSGGQWQRLALARTLLSDARVLVLDEPTSAVDAESESKLFEMLKDETPRRTILLVSHRAWTLTYADRIYVLDDGHVEQSGSFEDLANSEGLFKRLFKSQDWNREPS